MTTATLQSPVAPVRITLAVSLAVLVQSALALVWAGAAAERLNHLEEQMTERQQLTERTARLEEQVSSVRTTLERIERKIDAVHSAP